MWVSLTGSHCISQIPICRVKLENSYPIYENSMVFHHFKQQAICRLVIESSINPDENSYLHSVQSKAIIPRSTISLKLSFFITQFSAKLFNCFAVITYALQKWFSGLFSLLQATQNSMPSQWIFFHKLLSISPKLCLHSACYFHFILTIILCALAPIWTCIFL